MGREMQRHAPAGGRPAGEAGIRRGARVVGRARCWFVLAVLGAGAAALSSGLSGCAGRSGAEGEGKDIRLTESEFAKFAVRFSPDGRQVAFTGRPTGQDENWGVFVVPRQGGEVRRVSPDSLGLVALSWADDGQGLYCRAAASDSLFYLGFDGTLRVVDRMPPFGRCLAVSPDGATQLLALFNGDNRDLALRQAGAEPEFLAATGSWEEDGVFGPGPGDVTAVAFPTYQAPTSRIAVWSARDKSFSELPLPEGLNTQPSWSPDGRYLSYASFDGSQSDLWVYDSRAARAARLTMEPTDEASSSWSPDGDWLVFVRSEKTSHIYAGDPGSDEVRPLTDGPARDYGPAVSHDGQWVAFSRRPAAGERETAGPLLCVVPRSGGEVTVLGLQGIRLGAKSAEGMAWSYDGSALAFQGSDGTGKSDIYRINRDGSGLSRVTVGAGEELAPMWSPDGRFLSFTQTGGGRIQTMAVPATGGLPRQVSHEGAQSEGGMWAPDSDRLAYVAFQPDGTFEVWVTSLTRPEARRRVVAEKGIVWPAFWSADGRELILIRMSGGAYSFTVRDLETGRETYIGKSAHLPSGRGEYVALNARGKKYSDLFYPGGELVFAHGKDSSDLYLLRTRGLLEARLLAARGE